MSENEQVGTIFVIVSSSDGIPEGIELITMDQQLAHEKIDKLLKGSTFSTYSLLRVPTENTKIIPSEDMDLLLDALIGQAEDIILKDVKRAQVYIEKLPDSWKPFLFILRSLAIACWLIAKGIAGLGIVSMEFDEEEEISK